MIKVRLYQIGTQLLERWVPNSYKDRFSNLTNFQCCFLKQVHFANIARDMHKKRYCVKRRGSNRSSQSSTPAETKSGRSSSGGLAGKQGDTPTQHTNGSIQDNTAPSQQPAGILNLTLLSTRGLKGGRGQPVSVLDSLQFRKQCTKRVDGPGRAPCLLNKALQGSESRDEGVAGRNRKEQSQRSFFC